MHFLKKSDIITNAKYRGDFVNITHIVLLGLLILCIFILYLVVRFNTTVRKDIYEWFLIAEHQLKNGDERMQYVLDNTYDFLPIPLKVFINRSTYGNIVQKFFDEVHDLLDDGKRNKSNKK